MESDVLRRPNDMLGRVQQGVAGNLPARMAIDAVGFDYQPHMLMIGWILRNAGASEIDRLLLVVVIFPAMRQYAQRNDKQ